MIRRSAASLVVILYLVGPTAAADAWGSELVSFIAEPSRVGDRWLFGVPGAMTSTFLFEGTTTSFDGYGITRDVAVLRGEWTAGNEVQLSERCHRFQGGSDFVRADVLAGPGGNLDASGEGWSSILGIETKRDQLAINATTVKVFDGGSCKPATKVDGRQLREGERLPYCDLVGCVIRPGEQDPSSAPATATEFHGRIALRYEFDSAELYGAFDREAGPSGHYAFVLAEGIPGVVRREFVSQAAESWTSELQGFERGTGEEAAPYRGERLPLRHPAAAFVPTSARIDDTAFQNVFPFETAVRSARADPTCGLDAWLRAHPNAVLREASLDIGDREAQVPGMRGDAEWSLTFADGTAVYSLRTLQARPSAAGVVDVVSTPAYLIDDFGAREEDPYLIPAEMIFDAPAIAAALENHGMHARDIRSLEFRLSPHPEFPAELTLRSFSLGRGEDRRESGWIANFDMEKGSLREIMQANLASNGDSLTTLSPPSRSFETTPPASAFAALARPAPGAGLAVPAAATLTGLALLALAVKFLLPLFTRLVRDRLLDNPVRARLYEHVRANPGVHLAELEELLGIGKGATKHHVDQLARHRFVFVIEDAGKSRCYAAGHIPVDAARRHALLQAGSHQRVYDLLRAEPDLSLRAAAERLGMSAPSVHRARAKLVREGLLEAQRP